MTIAEFVEEAMHEIARGVERLTRGDGLSGAVVNPEAEGDADPCEVAFDLAVTVRTAADANAPAIVIADGTETGAEVSRIRFAVPIILPSAPAVRVSRRKFARSR